MGGLCSRGDDTTTVVIVPRMRVVSMDPAGPEDKLRKRETHLEYNVIKAEDVRIKENAPHRVLATRFLEESTEELYFSPKELDALSRMFKRNVDQPETGTMSFSKFLQLVDVNHAEEGDMTATEGVREAIENPQALEDQQQARTQMMRELFIMMDTDHSGSLDLKEFLLGFSFWKDRLANSGERGLFFFNMFDRDQNGVLDRDEFLQVIRYTIVADKDVQRSLIELSQDQIRAKSHKEFVHHAESRRTNASTGGSSHVPFQSLSDVAAATASPNTAGAQLGQTTAAPGQPEDTANAANAADTATAAPAAPEGIQSPGSNMNKHRPPPPAPVAQHDLTLGRASLHDAARSSTQALLSKRSTSNTSATTPSDNAGLGGDVPPQPAQEIASSAPERSSNTYRNDDDDDDEGRRSAIVAEAERLAASPTKNVLLTSEADNFVELAFKEADKDRSGAVSMRELLVWASEEPAVVEAFGSTPAALEAAFLLFDKDGNALLDREEFRILVHHTHDTSRLHTFSSIDTQAAAVVEAIFGLVDMDNDGTISFAEFKHFVNATVHQYGITGWQALENACALTDIVVTDRPQRRRSSSTDPVTVASARAAKEEKGFMQKLTSSLRNNKRSQTSPTHRKRANSDIPDTMIRPSVMNVDVKDETDEEAAEQERTRTNSKLEIFAPVRRLISYQESDQALHPRKQRRITQHSTKHAI